MSFSERPSSDVVAAVPSGDHNGNGRRSDAEYYSSSGKGKAMNVTERRYREAEDVVVGSGHSVRQQELSREPVVLRIRHLGKSYPIEGTTDRVIALKDIHLCEPEDGEEMGESRSAGELGAFGPIRRGEFVMIRGPSGGGKTTLLNIIGTIDSCTEGTVEMLDEVIDGKTKEGHLADIRLRTLGFVFQTFNLISTMTAAENVELPMTLMGKLSDKEIRLRARQLLTLVGLRNRVNHLPSELSGGEQQRVTIARSLANNPTVLLLDEPTGDLDTLNTIDVMDLLIRINRNTKTTCIMVTHNPDVECYADRILYVSDGRFVKEVRNRTPSCLDPNAYAKYLEEKEREITQITHWNNREGANDEGEEEEEEDDDDERDTVHAANRMPSPDSLLQSPQARVVAPTATPQRTAALVAPHRAPQPPPSTSPAKTYPQPPKSSVTALEQSMPPAPPKGTNQPTVTAVPPTNTQAIPDGFHPMPTRRSVSQTSRDSNRWVADRSTRPSAEPREMREVRGMRYVDGDDGDEL